MRFFGEIVGPNRLWPFVVIDHEKLYEMDISFASIGVICKKLCHFKVLA